MEQIESQIPGKILAHHGIVAAICKELRIADRTNEKLNSGSNRLLSFGHATVAMILNGLGFANTRMYMTQQFFEDVPVDILIGQGITPELIHDDALGDTLDAIYAYGSSKFFSEIAFAIALEQNMLDDIYHTDTTTISVYGKYDTDAGETNLLKIVQGYSKDMPGAQQLVLALAVNGKASLPVHVKAWHGNASDKVVLPNTVEIIDEFCKQLDVGTKRRFVGDSALFSKLLGKKKWHWTTRVPETIKEAKKLVRQPSEQITWRDVGDGYLISPSKIELDGNELRFILVFSQQAYDREKETLEKKLKQQEIELGKELWHLTANDKLFGCEKDAVKALRKIGKEYPLFAISHQLLPVEKHVAPGRPKDGSSKQVIGYRLETSFVRNELLISETLNAKGRFILATNDLDEKEYPDEAVLAEYKDQYKVENQGFRFLKDPWFMADDIYLKSTKRIEALMVVMTLCLFIYNYGQYIARQRLKELNQTVPSQVKKPTQKPTMRWLFQCMGGALVIYGVIDGKMRKLVLNVTGVRRQIVQLFGDIACQIYGVISKAA